jgi:hypothetical protein
MNEARESVAVSFRRCNPRLTKSPPSSLTAYTLGEFPEKMIKGLAANQAQTRKFDVGNRARPSSLF